MMNLNLFMLSAAAMVNAASGENTLFVDLGTASDFAILAKTGISTVPASKVTGDIAVSPIASAAITGFNLAMDSSGEYSTDSGSAGSQFTGHAKAPNYGHTTATELTTAVLDMETAYTDAAGRDTTATNGIANLNLGGGDLGGKTLTSGVYTFDIDVIISTGNTLTFHGDSDAVFIIQTSKSVKQAIDTNVALTGDAKAENIFWVVAQEVVVQAGSHLEGVLLVKTGVTFITGSSLNGRVLAQTAVTLQSATIDAA
ncbi:hypothetical protein FRACYDRAFT_224001 [Fragilariopsis cylindrus CCMP1102]|uniref:Antifreeze protein n=1 Tax=Fragilariopsis cylindrus CCMP1102 TaxID=635003 RepID=A0A1E7FU25_9STRA|nr:hypothetical protein FRACYDRAFT_224001 [Fragilariopsis cylindrus CCMP1102]|eukprot:OEU21661.1 hypothetical protein FRACYDRAFT_224001 [Fragilariopsis cylindrus CCMP1102]